MSGIKGLGAKCPGIVTSPLLVEGEEDTWDLLVINKVVPGSLHLYLATNDLFNHMEKHCWELKPVLKDFFVIERLPHSYQGKERNYQGPDIRQVMAGLNKQFPLMKEDPTKKLYFDVLLLIKMLANQLFSLDLHPEWLATLQELKSALATINTHTSFPMTP